jgi:hypothetical protein
VNSASRRLDDVCGQGPSTELPWASFLYVISDRRRRIEMNFSPPSSDPIGPSFSPFHLPLEEEEEEEETSDSQMTCLFSIRHTQPIGRSTERTRWKDTVQGEAEMDTVRSTCVFHTRRLAQITRHTPDQTQQHQQQQPPGKQQDALFFCRLFPIKQTTSGALRPPCLNRNLRSS